MGIGTSCSNERKMTGSGGSVLIRINIGGGDGEHISHKAAKEMKQDPPPLKACPRCSVTMQASRSHPDQGYDTFTCLNCDLVLDFRATDTTGKNSETD